MADQLCTTAQVKLRIFPAGVTDTADDALISELIDQVSDYIQQFTGRKLVPVSSTTYIFDTIAGYVLRIPIGIRTITNFGMNTMAHQPDSGGTYTTLAAADYLFRPKAQDLPDGWPYTQVWLSRGTQVGGFANVQNGVTITGTFGFAATPPEIQAVAIDAVVAAFQARKNGASGVIGANEGVLTPWDGFFGMGSPQRGTLDRYRYIGLG